MSQTEGPLGDSEQDPDFVDSENEINNDEDDDSLFNDNTTEGIEMGCENMQTEDTEGLECEKDDLEYPSSEELISEYSTDNETEYRFPEFHAEVDMKNPQLEVGQKFRSFDEFKNAVRHYGVMNRFNVRFKVNDPKRVHVVCKLGCKWRVWASKMMNSSTVQIKSFTPEHTCSRDQINRHCTYIFLANHYLDNFTVDPNWKTKNIVATVYKDLKVKISRNVAWKTRRYAKTLVEGTIEEQFGLLRNYAGEVLRTNPGSTVVIGVNNEIFQGIYICLNACKRGFVSGCRKVIGMDGCFLKANYGGQLLTAVGIDANDCIYPVAYAVVEKENTMTWRWFVSLLANDIGIDNGNDWTFMTDRQKGLQNVIVELFPEAEHRFCVRHMYSNFFKKDFKGKLLKDYLWRAAKSTTVSDYKYWMGQIQIANEDAYKWLMDRPPTEWSKSHFSVKPKCDIVLNNGCECFNKTLLEDREKSILTMLTSIQTTFMKRIQLRRDRMRRYNGQLCPKIKTKLDRNVALVGDCTLDWSGGSQYQVTCAAGTFVVDLHDRTCACRKWELSGIPCTHACAVILDERNDPMDFVDNCYKVETYLRCYEHIIYPMNGKKLWAQVEGFVIKPPTWVAKQKGRRQKKRRAGAEEEFIGHSQSKSYVRRKGQVTITCSVCSLEGHNSRYHLRPDAPDNDLFNAELEQNEAQHDIPKHRRSKGKMVPKRGNRCSSSPGEVLQSSYRFMPTPGIHPCAIDGVISGPSTSMPTTVATAEITQEVNISSTVEEVETQRAERARKRNDRRAAE